MPESGEDVLIFALRGALPQKDSKKPVMSADLFPARLDYRHMRCTIGLWLKGEKKILVMPGSTVPHRKWILPAIKKNGKGVNCMEPGFYTDYQRGEHLMGKLDGHKAFRQNKSRLYRRTTSGTPFGFSDPLFLGNPHDNLHAAWNLDPSKPFFSSAGCVVVAGTGHCPRWQNPEPEKGPWKIFRETAYASSQKSYPFLLVPFSLFGKIVESNTQLTNPFPGTINETNRRLQKLLSEKGLYRGSINGIADPKTYKAWNQLQVLLSSRGE